MHMRQLLANCWAKVILHRATSFGLQCRSARARYMSAMVSCTSSNAFHIVAPTEQSTQKLAAILAGDAKHGDFICLHGDVGAGKSVFSRAYIRALAQDEELPVPSPTYLLQNTYDEFDGPSVHHYDLYRLSGQHDLGRLNMGEALSTGICLVEWAERLEDQAPTERLAIHISMLSEEEKLLLTHDEEQLAAKDEFASLACSDAEESADEAAYVDRKWRKIKLQPSGDEWSQRCYAACAQMQKLKAAPDLHYL